MFKSENKNNEHKQKYLNQALMLSNKVKKQYNHLSKKYAKQNIEIFRLYDWNIPEISAVVDWYAGHIVVAEYVKKNSDPFWLLMMAESVAKALDIDMKNVHTKQRHVGYKDGSRYRRVSYTDKKIVMSERDLKFYINLDDYVDTGLFSDHRNTRLIVKEMAKGKDFLNLYCYTGSFSCYAAKGGAKTTVSVDRSERSIKWAKENMELNNIPINNEQLNNTFLIENTIEYQRNFIIKTHVFDFLEKAKKKGQKFDLAVVDPPSFSIRRDTNNGQNINLKGQNLQSINKERDLKHKFDIAQDHPELLKSVIDVMRKNSGSVILFSTNHQDFELNLDKFFKISKEKENSIDNVEDFNIIKEIKEITPITIPEDYKTPKKKIHRCWKIVV